MHPSGRVAVGHPIDVASGVMFNTFTGCWIGGTLPLTFERYYSTALLVNAEPGPLGPGFRHGYEHALRETLEGYAYTDAHGVEHTLVDPKDALGKTGRLIVPAVGIELRGDRNHVEVISYTSGPGHRFRFTRLGGSRQFRFDAVVSRRSPATRLDLTYDGSGRLVQVTQTRSGRRLAFYYDQLDRLAEVWLEWPRLRVAAFEYDAAGRLVGVADSVSTKVRYEYDANDRMVSEARRGGAIYAFRYDADGRCVYSSGSERFEERTLRYFPTQAMTEVIDSHGAVTRYHYNQAGQIVEEISPVGSRSQYQYDERSKLVFALEDGITQSALEYDELGRLTAAAAPDGRKMRIDYDDEHRPVRCTDLKGRAWEYRYEHGRLTGSKNPLGDEWQYRYDDFGDVIEITNPLGHSERFFWDAAGNLSSFVSPDGATWTYMHDELGRVVSVRDPMGAVTQFTYDAAGNQLSTQTADGRITRYEYDNADRLLAEYRPDGGVIRYRHNTCGQLVECVEADGRVLRFEWDTEPGRILAIVDGAGKRLSYEYDAAGRPIVRRNWDGVTQTFEYTPAGRLQAIVGPGDQRIEFEHDAWGRITRRKDPDGSIVEIEHDDEGPKAIRGPMGEVRYERDLYGRVLKEEQNGIAIENEYDRVGRLLRVRSPLVPRSE